MNAAPPSRTPSSPTPTRTGTPSGAAGWGNGLLGVLIFSGSLPATRAAVSGFDPAFLTAARAVIAALIGILLLIVLRQPRPTGRDLHSLVVVALGVVLGFPILTAIALQHIPAARSVVFIGLLPLATAIFGVIRGGERPRPAFWLFALLGSATIAGFALATDNSGSVGPSPSTAGATPFWFGDALMLAAIVVCGLGYAEGAVLSRRLGGWQVICWALVLSLPFMGLLGLLTWPATWAGIGLPAWLGLAYVALFSMLIGFIFWYCGLAIGGIARVGQLQLLQPFFGLGLSALLLGETVSGAMLVATTAVVACVVAAKRFG